MWIGFVRETTNAAASTVGDVHVAIFRVGSRIDGQYYMRTVWVVFVSRSWENQADF
jgi:hypothetical protein